MSKKSNSAPADAAEPPRRHWFFSAASIVMGGLVALVPAGVGLTTFLDPWRRKPSLPKSRGDAATGKEGYLKVASLSSLVVGAPPQRFPVIADQLDAWNFTPAQPVGAVFLQRTGDKEVRCFNATCPHAGCSVSCDGTAFVCPCHNSSFEIDGKRRAADSGRQNPSERDLDTLEIDAEKLAQSEGEVWIKFQNFYTGRHDKKPKT